MDECLAKKETTQSTAAVRTGVAMLKWQSRKPSSEIDGQPLAPLPWARQRPYKASATRRGPPSDDRHELPRPLTGRERRHLKLLVSAARLEQLSARRQCQDCLRELPRHEFRPARKTCTGCETRARIRRREAVSA